MRHWNEDGTAQWEVYGDRVVIIQEPHTTWTLADLRAMAIALGEATDCLPARSEADVANLVTRRRNDAMGR